MEHISIDCISLIAPIAKSNREAAPKAVEK